MFIAYVDELPPSTNKQQQASMLNKQYGLAYFIYYFLSLCCECVFTPNVNGIDKSGNKKN